MLSDLQAVPAFVALGHQIRLDAFRLLVRRGPEGVPSGEIAGALAVSPTAMSFHLAVLERAGLALARRDGRNIRYSARFDRMRELIAFLTADCCDGHPELCLGVADTAECDCVSVQASGSGDAEMSQIRAAPGPVRGDQNS